MQINFKITIRIITTIIALALTGAGCSTPAKRRAAESVRYLSKELANAETNARQIIAERATRPHDPAAAKRAAEAAAKARQVWLSQEIVPWQHRDLRLPDGSAPGLKEQRARQIFQSRALARQLVARAALQRRLVAEFLATHRLTAFTQLPGDRETLIVGIENGIPRALIHCNVEAADTVSADELWPGGNTGLGLTGTNTVIGLWDAANVREHVELGFFTPGGPRVTDMDGGLPYSFHTTHVAGTLIASGECADCFPPEDSPFARGMAYRGSILAWDFDDDYAEMAGAAVTNALHISNHSYALQAGWGFLGSGSVWFGDLAISPNEDYHFGFYSTDAQTIDQIAHTASTYLPVWAAANERSPNAGTGSPFSPPEQGYLTFSNGTFITSFTPRPNDGAAGGYDTISQQGGAKNLLTVGAVHPITNGYAGSGSVVMTDFSSFGPTDDGRIKPDLVADGFNVFSLGNDGGSYLTLSGTSMATPNVCGSLALLLELHDRLDGTNQPMLASTLKALAIHTADEAGDFPGPDYRFGWGLFNARNAGLLISNNSASGSLANIKEVRLTGGDYIEFPIVVSSKETLVVTAAWNDPEGSPPAPSLNPTDLMLVNDLDLRVISAAGVTNFPWVLDPVARTNAATTGDNFRDNVEQVVITDPDKGTYLVRVTHKGATLESGTEGTTNEQWVSIIISADKPQPQPPLVITSITALNSNEVARPSPPIASLAVIIPSEPDRAVAITWPSVVGRVYQVQYQDDLSGGSWIAGTGEISATKTNAVMVLPAPGGTTRRFYRVAQLR